MKLNIAIDISSIGIQTHDFKIECSGFHREKQIIIILFGYITSQEKQNKQKQIGLIMRKT